MKLLSKIAIVFTLSVGLNAASIVVPSDSLENDITAINKLISKQLEDRTYMYLSPKIERNDNTVTFRGKQMSTSAQMLNVSLLGFLIPSDALETEYKTVFNIKPTSKGIRIKTEDFKDGEKVSQDNEWVNELLSTVSKEYFIYTYNKTATQPISEIKVGSNCTFKGVSGKWYEDEDEIYICR